LRKAKQNIGQVDERLLDKRIIKNTELDDGILDKRIIKYWKR
jgi:hypothetical protein